MKSRRCHCRRFARSASSIVIREFGRIMRIWGQTLVPSAVTTTLYFVIFGSLVGQRIGKMGGIDYIAYIAPGLIMMSVITNSYANVVSSFFGAKFGKHIEELLVSPLPNWIIVLGYVCGGLMRGVMVGLVVTVVALIFTWLHSHQLQVHSLGVVVAAMLLTAAVVSLGGLLNAIFAKNFDQVNWIPAFVPRHFLFRRRVLFRRPAARLGAEAFAGESHPAHGQRVSLRLSRHLGCQRRRRVCDHDRLCRGAVRERADTPQPGKRHA